MDRFQLGSTGRAPCRLTSVLVIVVCLLSACSAPSSSPTRPAGDGGERAPGQPPAKPQASPRAALQALLDAESRNDHQASFQLLSDEALKTYPDTIAWTRRRKEIPAITGFRVEGGNGDSAVALVEHRPDLDPFVGLTPARERQTWRGTRQGGGWLLDAEPTIEPLFPPADQAPAAALEWARAVQACQADQARSRQAIPIPLGVSDAPSRLCGKAGDVTVGLPEEVTTGPATEELFAQYGPDSNSWATAVMVRSAVQPFHVVLAPIGDTWKVVSVFEP